MLGHFDHNLHNPNYVEFAQKYGLNYFKAPPKYWTWEANVKFLDRGINRGDKFVMSGAVRKLDSTFTEELAQLSQRGIWAEVFKVARLGRF